MIRKILEYLRSFFSKNPKDMKIYSLNEYLDVIGKYTDDVIRKEYKSGNFFTGGDCKIECLGGNVRFDIRMYFINDESDRSMKTSYRLLRLDNFDKESQKYITEKTRSFEILSPKMEE